MEKVPMVLMDTVEHNVGWGKNLKQQNLLFKGNQTAVPISKTGQSREALFEVEFVAWRPAQAKIPHIIPTPTPWPWRTEA